MDLSEWDFDHREKPHGNWQSAFSIAVLYMFSASNTHEVKKECSSDIRKYLKCSNTLRSLFFFKVSSVHFILLYDFSRETQRPCILEIRNEKNKFSQSTRPNMGRVINNNGISIKMSNYHC